MATSVPPIYEGQQPEEKNRSRNQGAEIKEQKKKKKGSCCSGKKGNRPFRHNDTQQIFMLGCLFMCLHPSMQLMQPQSLGRHWKYPYANVVLFILIFIIMVIITANLMTIIIGSRVVGIAIYTKNQSTFTYKEATYDSPLLVVQCQRQCLLDGDGEGDIGEFFAAQSIDRRDEGC